MSTVCKELAEEIMLNDGYYKTDPRVRQVVKYHNNFGGESWAILYDSDVAYNRYQESEYVISPVVVWEAK